MNGFTRWLQIASDNQEAVPDPNFLRIDLNKYSILYMMAYLFVVVYN